MYFNRIYRFTILFALALGVLFSSCNRRSQLLYLKNLNEVDGLFQTAKPVYRLKPADVLYVQLVTSNPEISAIFNNPTGSQFTTHNRDESAIYLHGYSINGNGTVSLPFLGDVVVEGMTIGEARVAIAERAKSIFLDASVIVKHANFRVTLVGEVSRPGVYRNFNDHLTVFEALALAGDMTDNAQRHNVLVVRTTDEGRSTYKMNLADRNILASQAYYIMPNDVIVVEPRANKTHQMNLPYINLILSTASTTLLLLRFIVD